MSSVGPIRGHLHQIYGQWWAHPWTSASYFVGPFKAIRTIFYVQCWAHSRPSAPDFMARGGPIPRYRCQMLWPVVGLAIGTIFYGQWWAHSRLSGPYSRPVVGPSKGIGFIFCGPVQGPRDH